MRTPLPSELEWVEARRAGSGLRGTRVGGPEGTNVLGRVRLGSAGGRGPSAEAGEGRGGIGHWPNQGAAASGGRVLLLPALRF